VEIEWPAAGVAARVGSLRKLPREFRKNCSRFIRLSRDMSNLCFSRTPDWCHFNLAAHLYSDLVVRKPHYCLRFQRATYDTWWRVEWGDVRRLVTGVVGRGDYASGRIGDRRFERPVLDKSGRNHCAWVGSGAAYDSSDGPVVRQRDGLRGDPYNYIVVEIIYLNIPVVLIWTNVFLFLDGWFSKINWFTI
jgi:hypothetical protein